MSTTVVETSPVWVYKLFSENSNSNSAGQNSNVQQVIYKNKDSKENLPVKQQDFISKGLPGEKICGAVTKNVASTNTPTDCAKIITRATTLPPMNDIFHDAEIYGETGKEQTMSNCICNYLRKVREPLVSYQEKRGLPRDTDHSFIGLMTTLFQATYHAALTIITMLINLTPLFEGFLYLSLFLVDKAIDICETESKSEKMWKLLLFIGEFIAIILVVMIMFCLILIPIWHLISYVLCKVWSLIFTSSDS